MGISGFEAFIMCTVSPFLLGIGPLRSLVVNNLRIVHLLSLVGVASYQVTSMIPRLCAVGFGLGMACLGWAATLSSSRAQDVRFESKVLGLMLGLILSSTAKFAWKTNNPIWPIMHAENGGWNGTGLIIGVLAALRFTRLAPLTGGSLLT